MSISETTNYTNYPSYVKIAENVESDDTLELPTEKNGSILLSTIQAQYPMATGLRYKAASGSWRGLRLSESALDPPEEGWGANVFYITIGKGAEKRKADSLDDEGSVKRGTGNELLGDLWVVGLVHTATEEDMRKYFSKFGDVVKCEIKRDPSGMTEGYGIIRFSKIEPAQKVIKLNHNVGGRKCEVQLPRKKEDGPDDLDLRKLFVGRLPKGTTKDDILDYFSAYGDVLDIFMPAEFRGFGYVEFDTAENASAVMQRSHYIKGNCINVDYAASRKRRNAPIQQQNYGYNEMYNNTGYSAYDYNNSMQQQQYGPYTY